ncbi:MAG TPA: hypothetical protein VKD28_15430 [Gemmatimonadales bacterium]|nr:hypothetical protein [Gemmatimonadales bacterium]
MAFLDADACGIEIRPVAQHGKQDPAEPVGHRDDGGFVPAPHRDPRKVRIERVGRAVRVVRRLAQHRAQLVRPARRMSWSPP